jgi:hypothetical protein
MTFRPPVHDSTPPRTLTLTPTNQHPDVPKKVRGRNAGGLIGSNKHRGWPMRDTISQIYKMIYDPTPSHCRLNQSGLAWRVGSVLVILQHERTGHPCHHSLFLASCFLLLASCFFRWLGWRAGVRAPISDRLFGVPAMGWCSSPSRSKYVATTNLLKERNGVEDMVG